MIVNHQHSSSFRDPSGHIFVDQGLIKRSILPIYFKQYNALKISGVFEKLFKAELLIPHEEVSVTKTEIILQPVQIPFVTYPYEWSFNMYKEAALLTLKLQKYCLENNFSLKDASAFNITFHKGKAIFIDTLSFDFYIENKPWRAYKQFVVHFLGPLVLSHYHGAQNLKLMSNFIDGIPLKMLSSMLPFKTKLNPTLYTNIHLLAKFEDKHNNDHIDNLKEIKVSKKAQLNIIKILYDYIKKLDLKEKSEWGNYYSITNYSDHSLVSKSNIINEWINKLNSKTLIDIGGNTGFFVRSIEPQIEQALICDIDNHAIDENYKLVKTNKERHITPFIIDILNPSASIGFFNNERDSFLKRLNKFEPDVTLALALIHHMTLSGNVPFEKSAEFFASFSKYLIIEFPKRNDSWVKRLLDIKSEFKAHFDFYNIDNFESEYATYFNFIEKVPIINSERVIYLLKAKDA